MHGETLKKFYLNFKSSTMFSG